MTDLAQPPLDLDPAHDRRGRTEPALRRSVAAARAAGRIGHRDDAAVAAALEVARALDDAIGYGATLETVIKGTTALRSYLAALNLTPASREDSYVDPDPDPGDDAAWLSAAAVPDPTDPG